MHLLANKAGQAASRPRPATRWQSTAEVSTKVVPVPVQQIFM